MGDNWLDWLKTTDHGRESLEDEKWTEAQYLDAKAGQRMEQADGVAVYIVKVGQNKYNVIVEDVEQGVITAMKCKTRHELDHLAQNYGWH